jgi:hypothetical protein
MAMRFYRLAELFLRYSQRIDSGHHAESTPTVSDHSPSGDEPPAHWLEMARMQAPQLYRSVLFRRIAAAKKSLNTKTADGDVVADTQDTEAEKPNNRPPPARETQRREEVLSNKSRERSVAQGERTRASPIDYPHRKPVKSVEPGGACVPKRPAAWLGQLRSRWGKANAKTTHLPGSDKRDAAFDAPLPDVDTVRTQGERPPSGVREEHASSSGARAHRQPVSRSAGATRERVQNEAQQRAKRANTTARQGALRADALYDEMTTGFSPPDSEAITGGDRLDSRSDAAMGLPAESHRSLGAKVDASREKTMAGIPTIPPPSTQTDHKYPSDMTAKTGLEAEYSPAPVSREGQSVEPSCWASLPDQVGKAGEELPWASLPDDVWTQPLRRAVIDRAGLPDHELYGSDEHKLSG